MVLQEVYTPYTASQMRNEYTDYYTHFDSDSPAEARSSLREKLLTSINEKLKKQNIVYVLDMGGGKQIFEQETNQHPEYKKIKDRVRWITIDISTIPSSSMLALNVADAIQADGSVLPFADNSFDIVFSSMAIDFMPRSSFQEVSRVIKSDGNFLVNFHHPDLIFYARQKMPSVLKKLKSAKTNYFHKSTKSSNVKKIAKAKIDLDLATIEFNDTAFIINNFPAHVFYSLDEIFDFLIQHFDNPEITLEKQSSRTGHNSWFFAQVLLGTE